MPFVLSRVEYCNVHFVYGFCDGNARAAVEEYRRRFPDRMIPSRGVFTRIHQRVRETGCLPSVAVQSERELVRTINSLNAELNPIRHLLALVGARHIVHVSRIRVNTRKNILEMVQRSPRLFTRRMASRIGVSRMQLLRTLHKEHLYPYHDQRVQHLQPGDNDQRMDLCYWIKAHPELVSDILSTDEASFTWDGVNNSRNVHMWPLDNPHETSVTNFQRRFSENVWSGVFRNRLFGTSVWHQFEGKHGWSLPEEWVTRFVGRHPLMIRSQMYFQHDGGPHFTLDTWGIT